MSKKETQIKIEKGVSVPDRKKRFHFDDMEPGDSFPFTGSRSVALVAFGLFLARGKYAITKEGDGYRFFLLKKE